MLMVAAPAGAATSIYVDKGQADCSDTGPGTSTTPLCTINAAVGRTNPGDTVVVASGTYNELVNISRAGAAGAPVTYTAAPGATVIVAGQENGFRISSESYIVVDGFHVRNTTSHGIIVKDSSNISVQDNEVSGAGAPALGSTARGITISTTTQSLVSGNTTHDNSDAGIFVGSGSTGNLVVGNISHNNARGYVRAAAGIDVRAASTTVSGNVSYDNEDSGLNVWDGATGTTVTNNRLYRNGDHGIDNKSSDTTLIVANTVHGNTDSGIEVVNSSSVKMANNISTDNGINSPRTEGNLRADALSAGSLTLNFDLVFLSSPGVMIDWNGTAYSSLADFVAATNKEGRGIEADPLFANAAVGSFALKAGSPAIDSANSGAAGQPTNDAVGHSRFDDPNTPNTGFGPRTFDDRGALEAHPK